MCYSANRLYKWSSTLIQNTESMRTKTTYIIDVKLKIPCEIIWHWGWFRRTNVLGGCNLPSRSIVHWNWTWHLYCIGQWCWLTAFEVIFPINFYGLLCATDDLFVHLIQPLSHEAIWCCEFLGMTWSGLHEANANSEISIAILSFGKINFCETKVWQKRLGTYLSQF